MIVLVSGLPRSGKSSFANLLESEKGFTHVPLDKYIMEVPSHMTFLDWVASPECIDWKSLESHLNVLHQGSSCITPQPDWNQRGKRISHGGLVGGGRRMNPSQIGFAIPGCHAFRFPNCNDKMFKVFVKTPRKVIAERLSHKPVSDHDVEGILDSSLSPGWQAIEAYVEEANLVISGTDHPVAQVNAFFNEYSSYAKPGPTRIPNS